MKLPGTSFYPAHPSNYTRGRNQAVTQFTVHHTAANNTTLRYLWANAARNGSSTLFVSPKVREQYVSLADTPWTNSNFDSNSKSITCEVAGDWRNGYKNSAALKNLEEVMYQCLKIFPHLKLTYHMDEARKAGGSTLCPADLKHKGYAQQCWDRAKARLAPKPKPAPVLPIKYEKIKPKRVELIRTSNLWNFNFKTWDAAKSVNPPNYRNGYPKGHTVDVVAQATNSLGAEYYMTAYSYNNGNVRSTHGFNVKDTRDFIPPKPKPTPKPDPIPELPIDTDPTTPGDSDVVQKALILEFLENLVTIINTFINKIRGK